MCVNFPRSLSSSSLYLSHSGGTGICFPIFNLGPVSVQHPVALINTVQTKPRRKELTWLTHPGPQSITERIQGRDSSQDLEVGTESEATEGYCLLACSPGLAQPALLI